MNVLADGAGPLERLSRALAERMECSLLNGMGSEGNSF